MMHGDAVSATFVGHLLPGSMFIAWALYWAIQTIVRGGDIVPSRSLERTVSMPVVKIVLAGIGVVTEIPGEGWYPQDVVMSWEHVTMYAAVGLTGIVDLLALRRLLPQGWTFAAYSAAIANAGFLFWGHSTHGGVEGLVHSILALVFFATSAIGLMEAFRPSAGLRWGRIGAQLALGAWFIVGAWIIYLSGWNLADPVREFWTYMVFSWTAMGIGTVVLGLRLAEGTRSAA